MEPNQRPPRRSRKRLWWALCLVALPVVLYVLVGRATSLRPREIPLRPDVRIVTNLAYSPDGKFLGFETDTTRSGALSWIDARSGRLVDPRSTAYADLSTARLQHPLPRSPRVTVSAKGVIEARDARTHYLLWATKPHVGVYAPHIRSAEFLGGEQYLMALDDDSQSWLLDAHSGKVLHRWPSQYGHEAYGVQKVKSVNGDRTDESIVYTVHELHVDPHSYTGTGQYRVEVYDPKASRVLNTFSFLLPEVAGLAPYISNNALSPDGKILANIVILHDSSHVIKMHAYLWHFQQGKPQQLEGNFAPPPSKGTPKPLPPEYTDSVSSEVQFSPDGRYLAVAGQVKTDATSSSMICMWDVVTGRRLHFWPETSGKLVFSQDSQRLANASESKVGVWDVQTGRIVRNVPFKRTDEADFALAPDGQTLATAEPNRHLVRLWPLAH